MMSDSESIINFTNSILHPCVPEILPENKTYGLDNAKFKKKSENTMNFCSNQEIYK